MIISVLNEGEMTQLCDVFPETILRDCDICIGAIQGSDVYGVLTAKKILKETWDITFIHVDPVWRNHHVAEDMLKLLAQTVRRLGAGAISACFFRAGDRDSLFSFAVRNGFEIVSESGVLGSSLSSVCIALDDFNTKKSYSGKVISLDKATDEQWYSLNRVLEEKRSEQDKKRGANSGMLYIIPEPRKYYKTEISYIALDKKDRPAGALLMREGDDYLSVDYLVNLISKEPSVVLNLMKASAAAMESFYGDVNIHFHTYNPAAERLARTLLGKFIKELGRVVYMIKYL